MIKFENGMLVLNSIFTKEDVNQINEYTNYIRKQENARIVELVEAEKMRSRIGFVQYGVLLNIIKGEQK